MAPGLPGRATTGWRARRASSTAPTASRCWRATRCPPQAVQGESFRDYLIWVGEDPAERRALAVSSSPYFRNNGEFGGAVLAYHDITELVVASRIKDEFVASVSHELRTPLTSIIGYVDVILDDTDRAARGRARLPRHGAAQRPAPAPPRRRPALDRAPVGRHRARHRAGPRDRAAGAAGRGGPQGRRRGRPRPSSRRSDAASDLDINGDGERLAQVFDNLFSNAVKYTRRVARRGSVARRRRRAVVRVRDTGRGISEAEQSEIFNQVLPGQHRAHRRDPRRRSRSGDHQDDRGRPRRRDRRSPASSARAPTFEVRLPLAEP